MAQTNEEDVTMNGSEQNEEDHSSFEEWTLLDKLSNDRRNINPSTRFTVTEDAREAIQVLEQSSLLDSEKANKLVKNRTESTVKCDEDSNTVSVINESDSKKDESETNNISSSIVLADKCVKPIATFTHIIVACSLAVVIGFGIGCIIGNGQTKFLPNDVNFGHIKSVKSIQRREQPNVKTAMSAVSIESSRVWGNSKITPEKIKNDEQSMNINDNNNDNNDNLRIVGSFQHILEKVEFSLEILCTTLDSFHKSSELNEKIPICTKPFSIMSFMNMKDNIENIIMEIEYIGDPSNKWFIENMEMKLKNITLSLINDLFITVKESVSKIDRKLNKMQRKLNKKLCHIRNTVGNDIKFQEILTKYNILEENCPTKKVIGERGSDSTKNIEEKNEYLGKNFYPYPVGPEVILETNRENSKLQYKDNRKKEKKLRGEPEKSYKLKGDYKSRKDLSKGDFTSEREIIELQKDKMKKTHHPDVVAADAMETSHDVNDSEEFCNTNSCSKQRNNDRKKSPDEANDNWQFKRSEGRFKWREQKNAVVHDHEEMSWDEKRARSRRNARKKY